jgi:hypothetical protein
MITLTFAFFVGLASPIHAQAPPPAASEAASTVSASFGLRNEYLVGDKLLVPITLSNPSDSPVTVPDLSSRPWLVSFEIESADGRTQHRRTAPPSVDSGRTLTLAPRARRYTLLEIPSGGAIPAGGYTLTVTVDLGDRKLKAQPQSIQVVPPRPVGGQVAVSTRSGFDTVWVHRAEDGFDLYLHQLDATQPDRPRGHWHLGHLDRAVTPLLSEASAADDSSRYVLWLEGGRDVVLAQIQGTSFRGEPRRLTVPWPKVEVPAAPMLDGRGRVSVPLWVPAPSGTGGEIRLLAFDERQRPVFRRVASFPARPTVRTTVDDSGNAHLVVGTGGTVDLYTLRADLPPNHELPVAGRRLVQLPDGERLAELTFVDLPTAKGQRGGLALQLTLRRGPGLQTRLVSMGGKTLSDLPGIPVADDDTLIAAVPGGWTTPSVVIERGGQLVLEQDAATSALPPSLKQSLGWRVVRGGDGQPYLVLLQPSGPVTVSPLALQPRG